MKKAKPPAKPKGFAIEKMKDAHKFNPMTRAQLAQKNKPGAK